MKHEASVTVARTASSFLRRRRSEGFDNVGAVGGSYRLWRTAAPSRLGGLGGELLCVVAIDRRTRARDMGSRRRAPHNDSGVGSCVAILSAMVSSIRGGRSINR